MLTTFAPPRYSQCFSAAVSTCELVSVYERDVIFLIGGGLHRNGPDLAENGRYFRRLVEKM